VNFSTDAKFNRETFTINEDDKNEKIMTEVDGHIDLLTLLI
jgi:hypothetical protein